MHLNVEQAGSNLNTLPGRIAAVIASRFDGVKDAATKVGLARTSVTQWKTGHKTPNTTNLGKFARVADVNLLWLLDGTGPVPDLTPKKPKKKPERAVRATRSLYLKTPDDKPLIAKGVSAFAALSLAHGIAFRSIRESRIDALRWVENEAKAGNDEWIVVPIEIRLVAG